MDNTQIKTNALTIIVGKVKFEFNNLSEERLETLKKVSKATATNHDGKLYEEYRSPDWQQEPNVKYLNCLKLMKWVRNYKPKEKIIFAYSKQNTEMECIPSLNQTFRSSSSDSESDTEDSLFFVDLGPRRKSLEDSLGKITASITGGLSDIIKKVTDFLAKAYNLVKLAVNKLMKNKKKILEVFKNKWNSSKPE